MSSFRGIRRKKSSLSEVRIAVVGAPGVGKTALTVRFLTKRYIGEYDHQAESRYKHEAMVDGEPVLFEILDTCPSKLSASKCPQGEDGAVLCSHESALWADGFLLVFSITDRRSYSALRNARRTLAQWRACNGGSGGGSSPSTPSPALLLASKADMLHLRQISAQEGEELAKELECPGCLEVSAADDVTGVTSAFYELGRAVLARRKRGKQSLLDRMLGVRISSRPPVGRTYLRGKSDSALP